MLRYQWTLGNKLAECVFDFEASKSNQEQVLVRPSKYPTRSPSGVKAFSTKTSQLTSLNK